MNHTPNSHKRPRGSGHDRRRFLLGVGALGVVGALPLVGGNLMPGIAIKDAARRLRELSAAYLMAHQPLTLAAAARRHLHVVVAALHEGYVPLDDRPQMFRVAVDTACMVGQGEFLAGRRATAAAYFSEATDLAYESLQPELVARALAKASRVHSPIYGGRPEEALRMLDRAVDLVESGLVRYWIGMVRAEELAALGRTHDCLAEYDRSVLHVGGGDSGGFFSRTGFLAGWDTAGQMAGVAGRCYWQLGESEEAIEELRRAVAASNLSVRGRPLWLIDLAQAYVVGGDLDAACDAASVALTECRATSFELGVDRIRDLRRSFPAAWRGSQLLADLDERLRS